MTLLALFLVTATAGAQLGEFQAGGVASYGTGKPFGRGAGLVVGVAPGRLAYVGLRWTYHAGTTEQRGSPSTEVKTRVQVFAMDLGLQIPIGRLEVVPGVGLGMVQFVQRTQGPAGAGSGTSKEFFAAPGISVEMRAARVAVIPEVQYFLAGHPELPWSVQRRGLVASVRLVFLAEVRRIRR